MRHRAIVLSGVGSILVLCGSASAQSENEPGEPAPVAAAAPTSRPAPNDYASQEAWLCRPGREDACTTDLSSTSIAPDGTQTRESFRANSDAPIDCFYVYPTVSLDPTPNSDMQRGPEEQSVIASQFARFASQCRTFAPLYRQITLAALRSRQTEKPLPADPLLAYGDVVAAWKHYLENDNAGRGFVLIGHSQGAGVLARLVAEEIDGKPVQERMLSALLIGSNIAIPAGKDVGGAFQNVPLCRAPDQLGCVVSYVSFRENVPPPAESRFGRVPEAGMQAACTNPASLAGGSGTLRAYLPVARLPGIESSETPAGAEDESTPQTPFVQLPGLLSAECVTNDQGSYLAVKVNADPSDPRADDIAGDVIVDGQVVEAWGLHLVDMNLAMGDLVDLVARQSEAYRARTKPAGAENDRASGE